MTAPASADVPPFWQSKRLSEMSDAEWEAVCDGCGRCCLEKLAADDTHKVYPLDVACELLDPATARCSDYTNRLPRVPGCVKLTATNLRQSDWLPPTCAYRRLDRGQPLEWWHPLVSGNPDSVRAAGISVVGRCIEPHRAGVPEYHTIDWSFRGVDSDPPEQWTKAMFGGVNASVPTPFAANARADLDLMAAHGFWLLANGCQGLMILDSAAEVAALSIPERMRIMQGLVARGLPASKLLAGVGPGKVSDQQRLVRLAADLGIRGILLRIATSGRTLPAHILAGAVGELVQAVNPSTHLYLSFAVGDAGAAAGLTALDALMSQRPGRLRGIRDETHGCSFGMAALDRFAGGGLEVYASDAADLMGLVRRGGAGVIGPGANLLSRACAQLLATTDPQATARLQQTITAIGKALRDRPTVPAIKTLLTRHTGRPEWNRMRLPLRPPAPAERTALFTAFDACGLKLGPPMRKLPRDQSARLDSRHRD